MLGCRPAGVSNWMMFGVPKKHYRFGSISTLWNMLVYTMYRWVFPKIVVPQNGWFTRENPIRMDDLGVPLFLETSR